MSECSTYLGNYGDPAGTIGLKTSIPGFDARDLSGDNDSNKRSFNSNWTNLVKVRLIGVAQGTSHQVQTHRPQGAGQEEWTSGWDWTPAAVATGLTYIPMWEERVYDQGNKIFYDDKLFDFGGVNVNNLSGARSYFSGPGLSPNIIWFEPWMGSPVQSPPVNRNVGAGKGFPAYPPQPVSPICVYIIYSNKLGDVA